MLNPACVLRMIFFSLIRVTISGIQMGNPSYDSPSALCYMACRPHNNWESYKWTLNLRFLVHLGSSIAGIVRQPL